MTTLITAAKETTEKANQPVHLNYLEYDMPLTDNNVQSTIPK